MKGIIVALAGLALLALGILLWPAPAADSNHGPGKRPASTVAKGEMERDGDFETFAKHGEKLEHKPASLRGTTPDGELREDDAHNLIVTEGVRRRFDYFLAALGEEDFNVIRARLAAHLQKALSARAARQAWALFEDYLGYRAELRGLPEHDGATENMRESLRARQALRQRWFDAATTEAFFGFEDRYAEFALDRRSILDDEALSQVQREQRLAALTASLPDDLQEMVVASRKPVDVAREVAALRANQASDEQIYDYREQNLGRAAADRLGHLDRQRQHWQSRYRAYRHQRAAIDHSGLAEADQQAEMQRLRERLFEGAELKRVEALDRIRGREGR